MGGFFLRSIISIGGDNIIYRGELVPITEKMHGIIRRKYPIMTVTMVYINFEVPSIVMIEIVLTEESQNN